MRLSKSDTDLLSRDIQHQGSQTGDWTAAEIEEIVAMAGFRLRF